MRLVLILGFFLLFSVGCSIPSQRYEVLRKNAWEPLPNAQAATADDMPNSLENPFQNHTELHLAQLIAEVEMRNPSLLEMQHAWQKAVARYPQVTSLDDPFLGLGIAPATIGSRDLDLGIRIDLSQKIPWPGKLSLRGEMALSEAQAAKEDLETARQRLMQETKISFFDYYFVYRAIEINEFNQTLLKEFLKIAESKYAAGTSSKQDVLQSEVELNQLLQRGIVLERMRKRVLAKINTLLNQTPSLELPPPPMDLAQPGDRQSVEHLRSIAFNHRPELRAIAVRIQGREYAQELAAKEYYPDFSLFAAYNGVMQESDLKPMVGFGLNLPLAFAKRQSAQDEAKAEYARLKARLAADIAGVSLEVQVAFDELVEAEHVFYLYKTKLIPAANENLAAAKSGYRTGSNDFLTLITAEKSLTNMQLSLQQTLAEYHQRLANLERAVGQSLLGFAESQRG